MSSGIGSTPFYLFIIGQNRWSLNVVVWEGWYW
jgi:hypothetical protein